MFPFKELGVIDYTGFFSEILRFIFMIYISIQHFIPCLTREKCS